MNFKQFSVKKCVKKKIFISEKIGAVTLRNYNSAHVIAFL